MSTTRRLIRTVLVVSLAAAAAGCIVVPRDPWGGHGGHHLDQSSPQQAPISEPGHRRPDGGRR